MSSAGVGTTPNTVVVTEERSVIDNFRNWYVVNVIDTGISQKFEEGLVNYHRLQEKSLDAFGKIATVVLAICPIEGPYGEAIAIVAKPFIPKLVSLKNRVDEKNIITAKRNFEANFIKADGSSEKVVLPEISLEQVVSDAKELMGQISELDSISSKGVSRQ